ncbi:hypothetical protein Dimus_028632 [Dionaea muscipula]
MHGSSVAAAPPSHHAWKLGGRRSSSSSRYSPLVCVVFAISSPWRSVLAALHPCRRALELAEKEAGSAPSPKKAATAASYVAPPLAHGERLEVDRARDDRPLERRPPLAEARCSCSPGRGGARRSTGARRRSPP